MDPERRVPGAQPPPLVRDEERLRRLRGAPPLVNRRPRGILGRDRAGSGLLLAHAVHARARHVARAAVDDLVDRRSECIRWGSPTTTRRPPHPCPREAGVATCRPHPLSVPP